MVTSTAKIPTRIAPATNPMPNTTDLQSLYIQRQYGMPPGWEWCGLMQLDRNRPGLGVIVEGAVPGVYKSGPRKGKKKWPPRKECQTFTVLKTEMDAFLLEWEQETGLCHKCQGEGRIIRRIFARSDDDYRTCPRCNGTGKAL